MSGSSGDAVDLLVVGAGPAGVMAALRAAYLGTRTTLLTSGDFGGMAANDGPVPIRTLAHVARLLREARQLGRYGVAVGEPVLDYPRLLERVREVVGEVAAASSLRPQIDAGFCKLVVDRASHAVLGCHLVGDRAVDVAQIAALAIAGGIRVDDLARVPLSFPTHAGILHRAAATAAHKLNRAVAPPPLLAGDYS
jgi:pyruvate/2-oxoglutarate dehydrogenase complex dihydrolipoamide dehydrogenase (E3) component